MKSVLFWSGGKDSAFALHQVLRDPAIELAGLLTTMTGRFDRVSMHGVRRTLLEEQAAALGFPLTIMYGDRVADMGEGDLEAGFTAFPTNEIYEVNLFAALEDQKARGVEAVIFGDLFLEDLRAYREDLMGRAGLRPLFPLWGRDSAELSRDIIGAGFRARIVCVDASKLGEGFAGRDYDAEFLAGLPAGIDPCGEYGEFHTFVYDGPDFIRPVRIQSGETVNRDGFRFADLLPIPRP